MRDGGDPYGVAMLASRLAPKYGIDYRTPVFAIHKNGHYGSIVGRGFDDLKEFHQRVLEAKESGADFIKSTPDRKSTRLNSSHVRTSRMPSSA